MTTLCIRIFRFFRRHRVCYWVSLVALFALCGYFASQVHLEEDINKLMPSSKNEDGSTKLAFANLRIKDKTFLLFAGKEGTDLAQLTEACDAFIDSLNRRNDALPEERRMVGDVFYRLSEDLLPDLADYLLAHFPAYLDTAAYQGIDSLLTREHLTRQMQANRRDLTSPVGSLMPELILTDPIGLRNLLGAQLASMSGGNSTGGYKIVDGHIFVPDSTVCLAFLTPMYSATNTGQGSALFDTLNELITQFSVSHPQVRIGYHGTPASGYYNARQIKSDLTGTITGALVLVLLFIAVCFRRWDTIPLLLLPVAFGALFGLAVMYFVKGQFSLLALGIGGVILGVALSYALHVMTHYKYVGDPEQMLRDQVKPVCLGCLTTVGSFMGLIFVRTELLQDFGLFASLAIIGTTAFSLIYLPQLLALHKGKRDEQAFRGIDRLTSYPIDRNKPVLVVLTLVVLVCIGAFLRYGTRFDADMHDLGYKAPLTTWSEELLRDKTYTGDKQKYFASSGRTMEEAISRFSVMEAKLDSLRAIGLVKSYTPTDKIFVPEAVQRQRIDAWKAYWTDERTERAHRLIQETAPVAGLRPEAFSLFFEAIEEADFEPDAFYQAGIIPEGYLSTLMEQSYDGTYLCFTSVRCANDTVRSKQSDYYRICDAVASVPGLMVLDTYYYTTDTLMQLNDDFNILQWVSMAFVLLVLFVSFRGNVRCTLLGFLPIVLSWLTVLGMMAMCGMSFNLINIIISTFVFGIGVDYSIFVMSGLTGGGGDLLRYHKTAIFFSAIILIVTVGAMLFATHPAIHSVGFTTLVGLLAAVLLSYVVQPYLYRLTNKKKQ